MKRSTVLVPLVFAAIACTPAPVVTLDASILCVDDLDCGDDLFCNGPERCAPDDPEADSVGCLPSTTMPCPEGCDELTDRCVSPCGAAEDLDGDGVLAMLCGGDDCDDADPERFPGNVEICDRENHDEDCDETTVGDRDGDRDTFVSSACCNVGPDGLICGDDCDDASAGVNRTNGEVCDTRDNDCDGAIDEGVPPGVYYRDVDGDGAGDPFARIDACTPPSGFVLGDDDCDDANRGRAPTAVETCNGQDDDCDLLIDDDLPGTGSSCTVAGASGACAMGVTVCAESGGGMRCIARTAAAPEACNGADDDCDGRVDEAVPGVGGACSAPGAVGACAAGTLRCFGASGAMCLAGTPATERCSTIDEDCDGDPINRGRPGGFSCLPGETRACSACGTLTGTESCGGSDCAWSGQCAVGGVGVTTSWSATDPRFTTTSCSTCCSSFPSGSRCCANGFDSDRYCLTGGGTVLPPARYALRMFGASDDARYPMTIEIVDTTAGTTRASRTVASSGCGPWSERIEFTHPAGACGTYEFRLRVPPDHLSCRDRNVSGIELVRLSDVTL